MKMPSLKRLSEELGLDRTKAKIIVKIGQSVDDTYELANAILKHSPRTAHSYAISDYKTGSRDDVWRGGRHSPPVSRMWRVTMAMNAIGEIIGSKNEVEEFSPVNDTSRPPSHLLLSPNEPYGDNTLVYCRRNDTVSICDWDSFVRNHPELVGDTFNSNW
jgi:hypothetical protein